MPGMSQRRWKQDAPDHWTAKAKGKPTLTVWNNGSEWRWDYWGDPNSDEPTVSAPGLSFENAKQCAEEWRERPTLAPARREYTVPAKQ
jgi:hypothetical protein